MTRTQNHMHIRWAIRRDLPELLAIERESFPHPWDENMFLHALRQARVVGLVAEVCDYIAGYIIYETLPRYYRVLNLAVAADFRLQGIGTAMIEKVAGKLHTTGRQRIEAMVSEINLPAQLFLRERGFMCESQHRAGDENDWDCDGYNFIRRIAVD